MNYHALIDTPIGKLLLTTNGDALTGLYFDTARGWPRYALEGRLDAAAGVLPQAARQLEEYFAGERRDFDLPLQMHGTEFQRQVWQLLRDIPYGVTCSYGELARRGRNPTAFRAVGLANGRNPIAVIVPCHRVIGADGSLTGFGGGIDRKRWLLTHEHALPTRVLRAAAPGAGSAGRSMEFEF